MQKAGALLYEGAGRLAGSRADARAEVAADLLEGVAHGLGDAAVVGEGELGGIGMPDTGVALVGAVRRDGGKPLDARHLVEPCGHKWLVLDGHLGIFAVLSYR